MAFSKVSIKNPSGPPGIKILSIITFFSEEDLLNNSLDLVLNPGN